MAIGCLRLSDISVICRIVNPHPTCSKNLGILTVYGLYWAVEWLWIDSNGKNRNYKSRNFGSEFPAIWIVPELWRPLVGRHYFFRFLVFFLKITPITVKFSKFCSESFHRDTDRRVVFKFREIWPTKHLWNRALLTWQKTKFRLALQL